MTNKYTIDLLTRLPKYPLPDLEQTLARAREWSAPLLGASEQQKLAEQIADFKRSDAPVLQSLLEQRWAETNANWITPILQHHYLLNREPLQLTSNFAFTIAHTELPDLNQITMAAKLLQNVTDQYLAYVTGDAPVETNSANQPLDMTAYQFLFRTQRRPGFDQDFLQRTRNTVTNVEATVIYHQTIYQIRLIDHAGRVSTLHSLTESLKEIMQNSATDSFFIGAYTGLPRDIAVNSWQQLTINQYNRDNLARISNSLLVLDLLDTPHPITAQTVLLDPQNRIAEKTIQIFVDSDANIGFNFENSQIDAAPASHFVDTVVTRLSQPADQWDSKGKPHYQQLDWQLDHYAKEALAEATRQTTELAKRITVASANIPEFGSTQLQAMGIDPDAFIQISLALAQYRATGGWRNIVETVSLRNFYQGRTEKTPTVTPELKQFIEAFAAGHRDSVAKQLFDHAVQAHHERIDLTQKGVGITAHLLGLQEMMRQHGGEKAFPATATLFNSDFLKQLTTAFFSTANLSSSVVDSFVAAPASQHGYGINYNILNSQIRLTVSSWLTNAFNAQELLTSITESLNEIFAWLAAPKSN